MRAELLMELAATTRDKLDRHIALQLRYVQLQGELETVQAQMKRK